MFNTSTSGAVISCYFSFVHQVNGQDLSQSSHYEAVEAFRTAKEPIIVEVLRRTGKGGGGGNSSEFGGSSGGGDRGMKSRCPTMVSIGTQTEEDFYCYNRPPTPPPGFYPIPLTSGLYQPSSRRPVAFSPSAEMGLTDIEMAHNLDIDDPYFDDRQYEIVYEEVLLRRTSSDEKLGLTLCYGSLEDELTEIFISEVDPCSIAGRDGRIREGDQIVQINGVDVRSRSEAISLFSGNGTDITLTVARAQLQCDDGFMEEPNVVLDDLHMDLLEQHHHDNMQFMASMLARRHLDEEGGTTDTATTENSSQKHEKDSGVGRTDESTRNEESSEQENVDYDSFMNPAILACKGRHPSNDSLISSDIPGEVCSKLRDMFDPRLAVGSSPRRDVHRKDSGSSLERELALLNQEMEEIQVECQDLVENHIMRERLGYNESVIRGDTQKSPRIVPRMGTRLEYVKHPNEPGLARKPGMGGTGSPSHSGAPVTMSSPLNNNYSMNGSSKNYTNGSVVPSSLSSTMSSTCRGLNSEFSSHTNTTSSSNMSTGMCDKDMWTTTSAYNTGESCRSTPLTLELNPTIDENSHELSGSMLCLATPSSAPSAIVTSDTEKQTQTPTKPRDYSSGDSGHGQAKKSSSSSHTIKAMSISESMKSGLTHPSQMGESLQDLYLRCADVMYTNRANLQHTIAVQQKLFQQQLEQNARLRGHGPPGHPPPTSNINDHTPDAARNSPGQTPPSDSGQMEWVVKRRPDGTRYITRRPVRNKLLKERAKKISEERCGMTTDDDAMSEMKTGRYWSKEDRKRHLEKAKDYKKKKELLVKAKMETLRESEEKKEVNIVELSHRKMMKHKGKKVFDNFTTVKEMLAHGNKVNDGKTYNPLLSVTTV
ncbi:E3 ubiquitin-protein ligase PDZRN3 [Biomphalaria pfeifferi]|uniref:E3 ubiquitin-protein ligase PDZRN3 n=1 Tax=Biomphalaria pfeifferi TaxID=112525 RepID=A0AAD8BZT1_BIOPF|nr:E3 ubiquitin-protein ligase PDZRN3 [Biomphalaria pfeifferi]